MSLFPNMLLCLNLSRLMIEPKVGLECVFFAKQMNINKFFHNELFINNLIHLQSY